MPDIIIKIEFDASSHKEYLLRLADLVFRAGLIFGSRCYDEQCADIGVVYINFGDRPYAASRFAISISNDRDIRSVISETTYKGCHPVTAQT